MDIPINANFTVDDIHNVRLKMAEEYSNMLPEKAEYDFQRRVTKIKQRIEEIRHLNQTAANEKSGKG